MSFQRTRHVLNFNQAPTNSNSWDTHMKPFGHCSILENPNPRKEVTITKHIPFSQFSHNPNSFFAAKRNPRWSTCFHHIFIFIEIYAKENSKKKLKKEEPASIVREFWVLISYLRIGHNVGNKTVTNFILFLKNKIGSESKHVIELYLFPRLLIHVILFTKTNPGSSS